MKLLIEIEMDNAAFEEHPLGEASRILLQLASDIGQVIHKRDLQFGASLRDINGNKVGFAKVED